MTIVGRGYGLSPSTVSVVSVVSENDITVTNDDVTITEEELMLTVVDDDVMITQDVENC